MTGKLDPRIVRVGIEVDGQVQWYEGLDIHISCVKFANPLLNTCDVTIANLAKATRDYVLSETSPFNENRTPKRLIVEAGRESVGTTQIFIGDITAAGVSQPPDPTLRIKAQTTAFLRGDIIKRGSVKVASLRTLAQQVAASVGASLVFEATDKNIENYSFSGAASKEIDHLAKAGEVDIFVDDTQLIVKDYGVPLTDRTRVLSMETGMIGVPELTDFGVRVKMLLDTETTLGGALDIRSETNPALSGIYAIYKLTADISSRDQNFYYTAEGRRYGG